MEEPRIKVLPELSERNSNSWARTRRTSLYYWNNSCIIEVVRHAIFPACCRVFVVNIFMAYAPFFIAIACNHPL